MRTLTSVWLVGLLAVGLAGPTNALAQEQGPEPPEQKPPPQTAPQQQKQQDNTGTNPINFTYDARFYMETSWFDGESLIAPTFEFRLPLGADMANLTNQKQGIFNDLGAKNALRLKFRQNPPQASDFTAVTIPEDDIEDLRECEPGDCALKLAGEGLEELQARIDWKSPITASR